MPFFAQSKLCRKSFCLQEIQEACSSTNDGMIAPFIHSEVHVTMRDNAGLENAYPWPIWKSWFSQDVKSNSTATGNLAALALAGAAFG